MRVLKRHWTSVVGVAHQCKRGESEKERERERVK